MKIILLIFSIICPFLGLFIANIVEGMYRLDKEIIHYSFGYVFGGVYFFTLMLIIVKFGALMK